MKDLTTHLATVGSKLKAVQKDLERDGAYNQDILDSISIVEKVQDRLAAGEKGKAVTSSLLMVVRIIELLSTYFNQS